MKPLLPGWPTWWFFVLAGLALLRADTPSTPVRTHVAAAPAHGPASVVHASRQGVRTARVVQERPELTTYTLRLPKATAGFKAEVLALAGKGLDGKSLRACK